MKNHELFFNLRSKTFRSSKKHYFTLISKELNIVNSANKYENYKHIFIYTLNHKHIHYSYTMIYGNLCQKRLCPTLSTNAYLLSLIEEINFCVYLIT